MADFTPKKVSSEKGSAKGSLPTDNAEHQRPPTIYLEHHHLEKLGLKNMPKVGSKIKISGLAHVGATSEHDHSASASSRAEGTGATTPKNTRSMTLHLHKMDVAKDGIEGVSDVDQEEQSKAGALAEVNKALEKSEGGKKSAS